MEQQVTLQTDKEVKNRTTKEWDEYLRNVELDKNRIVKSCSIMFLHRLQLAIAEINENSTRDPTVLHF